MKKIFFIIALLCPVLCQAQDSTTNNLSTYINTQDQHFRYLDKTALPNANLYDRVFPWANLDLVNFLRDTTDNDFFIQAFSEIAHCQLDSTVLDSFSIQDYKNWIPYQNKNNQIPLMLTNFWLDFIDSNAIADKRLFVDDSGYYHIGSNTTSLPYNSQLICFANLGIANQLIINQPYTITPMSLMALNNNSDWIAKIVITSTLENKTWSIADAPLEITFTKEGIDYLRFDLYNTAGVLISSNTQKTQYRMAPNGLNGINCTNGPITVNGFQDYQGAGETKGYKGQGEYVIFYGRNANGSCHTAVQNAIIISDAWDPGDARQISVDKNNNNNQGAEDLYHDRLSYTNTSGTNVLLVEQLRNLGYDVVIVNYNVLPVEFKTVWVNNGNWSWTQITTTTKTLDGGTDFVERNAQIMVSVIKDINNDLQNSGSTNKIVLLGPSMGGQICRYALRWMEQQKALGVANMDHNCRLYISFDSPQSGANIDFGLQETLRFFGDNLGKEQANTFLTEQIRTPGAREMLISQIPEAYQPPKWYNFTQVSNYNNYYIQNQSNYFQGFHPMHTDYYNQLNSMGLPQNCRNVGVASGSYSGGDYHAEGSLMFGYRINKLKSPGKGYPLLYNETRYVSSNSFKSVSATITLQPGVSDNFFDVFLSPIGALDAAPGGIYDMQEELYKKIPQGSVLIRSTLFLGDIYGNAYLTNQTHNSCFIPSFSSLGIINNQMDWRTPINIKNLVCNHNTIFDNVYAPNHNTGHTILDPDNVAFFLQEIQNGHQGTECLNACSMSIDGNDMCVDGEGDYSVVPPLPAGTVVDWMPSNADVNLINITNGVAHYASISSNPSVIKATVHNPCGANFEVSKTIYKHKSYNKNDFKIINTPINCTNYFQIQYTGNIPILNDIKVKWSHGTPVLGGGLFSQPMPMAFMALGGCQKYDDQIWAIITDNCGLALNLYLFQPVTNAACNCKKGNDLVSLDMLKLDIYPNPTSNSWNIILYNFENTKYASLKLYDINGKEVWQEYKTDFTNSNIEIPAANLPKGVYLLKVITDKQNESFKLLKE